MRVGSRLSAALRAFLNPALRLPRPIPPPEPTRVVVDKLAQGRSALVTGAGRGIGRSISLELASHGADVYATDMDPERCAGLREELARLPGKSRVFCADVTRPADTDALLDALEESGVIIDLLVNNVGVVLDDLAQSFDTNVTGPVLLTRRITQALIDRQRTGSVIFLTSIHQDGIFTRAKGYGPSKAALGMVIKQLAIELAPHRIRVNGIAPGDVREDERGDVVPYPYTPLEGSSIPPRYIARAVVYLASEYFSRHTTGSVITIDGGLSLFNYQTAFDAGLFL